VMVVGAGPVEAIETRIKLSSLGHEILLSCFLRSGCIFLSCPSVGESCDKPCDDPCEQVAPNTDLDNTILGACYVRARHSL